MSGSTLIVAINALLLKRTKLTGIKSVRLQSTPAAGAQVSSGVSA
jgi:Cu2+-exporting ATPase